MLVLVDYPKVTSCLLHVVYYVSVTYCMVANGEVLRSTDLEKKSKMSTIRLLGNENVNTLISKKKVHTFLKSLDI